MKYMGSKQWMLQNGLGHLLHDSTRSCNRFVDMFTGSGAVAAFVATGEHPVEVLAFDLQEFCVTLAGAIIERTYPLDADLLWREWHQRAQQNLQINQQAGIASESLPPLYGGFTRAYVNNVRAQCSSERPGVITRAYGGYYFSGSQAAWIDALMQEIPTDPLERRAALAALLQAASECAASPGHTAQPFAPTRGAKPFLHTAWRQSVVDRTRRAFMRICAVRASTTGRAEVKNANDAVNALQEGDLVFLDPPYSGVHYSRFYHVLETIARGRCGEVSGSGRYPPAHERPRSTYSIASEAAAALDALLQGIAEKRASAILTFPQRKCSNGLSGGQIFDIAAKYFMVHSTFKRNRFSTLGGTKDEGGDGYGRAARQNTHEQIFILMPW